MDTCTPREYRGALVIHCEHFQSIVKPVQELAAQHVSTEWRQAKDKRDGTAGIHITVVEPAEWGALDPKMKAEVQAADVCENDISVLGCATQMGCAYACIHSSKLSGLRLQAGLPPKHFHITLGFDQHDNHSITKSIETINHWVPRSTEDSLVQKLEHDLTVIRASQHLSRSLAVSLLRSLEHVATAVAGRGSDPLRTSDQSQALAVAVKAALIRNAAPNETASLVDDLAALDPVLAYYLSTRHAVAKGTMPNAADDIHRKLHSLASSRPPFDQSAAWLAEAARPASLPKAVWGPDKWQCTALLELPRNLAPVPGYGGSLWGSGLPSAESVRGAVHLGCSTVVTLTEEPLPAAVLAEGAVMGARFYHCPIDDRRAPESVSELIQICRCAQRGLMRGKVLVHCLGGKGRTALVLAGVLVLEQGLSAAEAMARVKENNRAVLVTEEQVRMLKHLHALATGACSLPAGPASSSSSSSASSSARALPKPLPRVVMLCGLPGCGKSTFASALASAFPGAVRHVNQDELGKREAEEAWSRAAAAAARGEPTVAVLDKCHATRGQRAESRAIAGGSDVGVTLVRFAAGLEACQARAAARRDHVGDVCGPRALKVVAAVARTLEEPAPSEGFRAVHVVENDEQAAVLLRQWGVPVPEGAPAPAGAAAGPRGLVDQERVCGFPRTQHLTDLGAASRDDLNVGDASAWLRHAPDGAALCVEEKVDGANLGFRLAPDGYTIRAQNRSHYISSADHPQFRKLAKWQQDHEAALRAVLRDPSLVLYGEWLYATHSVAYDRLPGYFVAFDLRCVLTDTFVSRAELRAVLPESVPMTPALLERPAATATMAEVLALVRRGSSFAAGSRSEGVYVRLQRGGLTLARAKIVRPDFIAGNEHWSRGPLQQNTLSQGAMDELYCASDDAPAPAPAPAPAADPPAGAAAPGAQAAAARHGAAAAAGSPAAQPRHPASPGGSSSLGGVDAAAAPERTSPRSIRHPAAGTSPAPAPAPGPSSPPRAPRKDKGSSRGPSSEEPRSGSTSRGKQKGGSSSPGAAAAGSITSPRTEQAGSRPNGGAAADAEVAREPKECLAGLADATPTTSTANRAGAAARADAGEKVSDGDATSRFASWLRANCCVSEDSESLHRLEILATYAADEGRAEHEKQDEVVFKDAIRLAFDQANGEGASLFRSKKGALRDHVRLVWRSLTDGEGTSG